MKWKYIFISTLVIILLLPVLVWFTSLWFSKTYKDVAHRLSTPSSVSEVVPVSYHVSDDAKAPQMPHAVTLAEFIRETAVVNGQTLQSFIVKSHIDGSERTLLTAVGDNVTFEKITPQNWSPTNRFLFVYRDLPQRRDLLFFKIDGKFTNAQYFLAPMGIYPELTVRSAYWIDAQTLGMQTEDIQTHVSKNYIVDFDDDTGIVKPAE